jgi:pilus assembly protein CpaB
MTLEVTPEEAEKLSLAAQEGQIVMALRGLGDDAPITTIGSNKRDLLAVAAAPRKSVGGAPPPPDKYRVEVIHGNTRNVVEF